MAVNVLGWIAAILAVLMIICTVLPIWPTNIWWIRDMGFPRVQILILLLLSVLPLLIYFRSDDRFFAIGIVGALCILYQVWEIYPYTSIAPQESTGAEQNDSNLQVTLMVANVLMENRKSGALMEIVRDYDPDIFFAVETDEWWTKEIRDSLGERYPHIIAEPIDNTYGLILLSRYELTGAQVEYLVIDTVPSVITTVELPSGDHFRLYGVHPLPPLPGMDTEERDAELLIVGKKVKADDMPSIVFGDLNDVAWSKTTSEFQEISSMLDPRRGRGMFNTFSAEYFFLRYPLDHVFHTKEFRLVSMKRLPAWGSDHFPIGVTFSYEPENQHEQKPDDADADEEQEANEKIDEGLEEGKKVEQEDVVP